MLFKICRGQEKNLPTTYKDGYCYYTTDLSNFFIDYKTGTDDSGNDIIVRKKISAEYADKLRYFVENNNGTQDVIEINPEDILTNDNLQSAIEEALKEAKQSGDFDGADGSPGRDGNDGREVRLQKSSDGKQIQWKYDDETEWDNLVAVNDLTPVKGTDYWTENDKNKIINDTVAAIDKNILGLDKVDNTSDEDKPVSTATREAIESATLYTNSTPTINEHGGIPAGTTFENKPIKDILEQILYPYIEPTLSVTASTNGGNYEQGESVTINTITATIVKNSAKITKIELYDSTNATQAIREQTGSELNGTITFSNLNITINSTKYFFVKIYYDGTKEKTANTGTFTFTYVDPTITFTTSPSGGTFSKTVTKTVTSFTVNITKHSGVVSKIEIYKSNDTSTILAEKVGNSLDGQYILTPANNISVTSDTTFVAKITYDTNKTKTASATAFTFKAPCYWGVVAENATITDSVVKAFTNNSTTIQTSITYTLSDQKMVYAISTAMGTVKKITDPSGVNDYTGNFNVLDVTIQHASGSADTYKVWVAKTTTSGTHTLKFTY